MKKLLSGILGVFMLIFVTSCTQRSCPTYTKQPVEKTAEANQDIES